MSNNSQVIPSQESTAKTQDIAGAKPTAAQAIARLKASFCEPDAVWAERVSEAEAAVGFVLRSSRTTEVK